MMDSVEDVRANTDAVMINTESSASKQQVMNFHNTVERTEEGDLGTNREMTSERKLINTRASQDNIGPLVGSSVKLPVAILQA